MKIIGVVMLDERQESCANYLERFGFKVRRIRNQSELEDVIEMNALVLPVRGVNEKEQIVFPDGTMLDFRMMKKLASCGYPDILVFSGTNNAIINSWNLPVVYLMTLESVIEANAQLTAQGVLTEILKRSKRRIQDLKIDVVGYGHCGRWIVDYLLALEVPVRLIRRNIDNPKHSNEMSLEEWQKTSILGDIVINTAPALVINETMISSIENNPFFIDIASKPGGMDYDASAKKGLEVFVAPPLPSVYTPVSAGEILANAIKEEMNKFE